MTEREELAQRLRRTADIARGLNKTANIVGIRRDYFVDLLEKAASAIMEHQASVIPFQSECPCGRKITVAFVNGQRRVKWSE